MLFRTRVKISCSSDVEEAEEEDAMAVVDQISLFTSPPKKTDQYNNRKMDLIEVLEIDDLGGDVAPPWARPLCTYQLQTSPTSQKTTVEVNRNNNNKM